jgi:hypothetical protein
MMKQIRLSSSGFELFTNRTRKRVFLDEMSLDQKKPPPKRRFAQL